VPAVTVPGMEIIWVGSILAALVAGIVVGALLGRSSLRVTVAEQLATLRAERDQLAHRLETDRAQAQQDRTVAAELAPLRHTLDRVAQHVTTLERDRLEHFGEIGEVLRSVASRTETLGEQTATLSGALNSSGVRGVWGEAQLRRVLEHAGMLPHCDFEEQVTTTTRHDRAVRPDVVVHLPGEKTLVVDAKAPLQSFLAAQADVEPHERDRLLKEHAAGLRRHVDALAAKDYWSAFDRSPELVVCFVPSDAVLAAALTSQPGLYDHAQGRKVVLTSPATLLAVLRATAYAWQQDALSSNARQLLQLGTELHARLGTLGKHVGALGSSLRRSVETYNQFLGTLETRVMVTSRKMAELGVVADEVETVPPVEVAVRSMTQADLLAEELESGTPGRDLLAEEDQPAQGSESRSA